MIKQIYFILLLLANFLLSTAQNHNCQVNEGNYTSFNINKEMVDMFVSNLFDTISACNNNEAIVVFEQRIDTLQSYICNKNENNLTNIIRIVLNFELLTQIESESDGNFIGKYNPTNRDIERWIEWFVQNQTRICWYEEKNILYLKSD